MWKIKFSRCLWLLIILILLSLFPISTGHAQQTVTITGTGTFSLGYETPLTMTFSPSGGPVSGHAHWEGNTVQVTYKGEKREGCPGTAELTLTGTFAGGDGGEVSGTLEYMINSPCFTMSAPWPGIWSGHLYANGTGSGEGTLGVIGTENSQTTQWQITYSAEQFAAGLPPEVTAEYIYKTYGIIVEDSFGDDQYEQTAWTDKELVSLNNVLKKLPPALIKNMRVKRIVRNKVYIDKDGNPRPTVNGVYSTCPDRKADPSCDGSAATVRIFDNALIPSQVFADPTTKFEAVILHELIHAAQYKKDEYSIYNNAYNSPLVQNFIYASNKYASGPQESLPPGINVGWHWGQPPGNPPPPRWTLYSNGPEHAPTNYATTNPLEDMCDSAMLYMYDPQKLKNESPGRYDFFRDQLFGGVEYGNGQ
jgi:hypothetical protein